MVRPDGQPGIYGVVETRVATGVVAITSTQELYLVGQYRYPLDCYSWEIIEGGTDGDEEPLAAARRELKEEAGLRASRWSPLGGEIHLSNCITSERGFLYLAEDLIKTEAEPDATEVLQLKTASLSECLRMVEANEITDAMSIMGILLYARLVS